MKRLTVGQIKTNRPGGHWRHSTFVMNSVVRLADDEWVEWISIVRPVRVSRDGLLLTFLPFDVGMITYRPGEIMGGTLRFNVMHKK